MLGPRLDPGIEYRRNRAKNRVDRGQVGSLSSIAFETGECQVLAFGSSPVPERDYVVNLMREREIILMDAAVFTPSPRSIEDLGAECSRDWHACHRIRLASLTLTARVP